MYAPPQWPCRYAEIDLALLHIGGRVLGLMVTMDADQVLRLMRIVRPRVTIPLRYNDYTVFKAPLETFVAVVAGAGIQDQIHWPRHGET